MTGRGGGAARKTLLAPIHFIFSLLQKRNTVSIWLYENLTTRIEGKIRVSKSYMVCAEQQTNAS
jgi:small nuclear ribonucleoprotein E